MSFLKDLFATIQGAKSELDREDDSSKLIAYVGILFAGLVAILLVVALVAIVVELALKVLPVVAVAGIVYGIAILKGWVKAPSFLSRKK